MVSKLPLPLVHGTGDTEVSPLNSEILFAAAGEHKELRSPSNMGHTSVVRDLEDEYSKIVIGLPRASGRFEPVAGAQVDHATEAKLGSKS